MIALLTIQSLYISYTSYHVSNLGFMIFDHPVFQTTRLYSIHRVVFILFVSVLECIVLNKCIKYVPGIILPTVRQWRHCTFYRTLFLETFQMAKKWPRLIKSDRIAV